MRVVTILYKRRGKKASGTRRKEKKRRIEREKRQQEEARQGELDLQK
ncbi:hypothetical protein IIC45_00980 [Patescibacteria group bacterium]|nr:hypothetical protein [Patescibacteria group bacterium]